MADDAYLFDTSAVFARSDVRHRLHTMALSRFRALQNDWLFISMFTIAEVEYGLRLNSSLTVDQKNLIRHNLGSFKVLPTDSIIYTPYADIKSVLFERFAPKTASGGRTKYVEDLLDGVTGKMLGVQEMDLWIVATAVHHDLKLVTGDIKMRRVVEAAGHLARTEFWEPSDPPSPH